MSRAASKIGAALRFVVPPAVLLAGLGGFFALAASRERPQPREIETPPLLVQTVTVGQTEGGLDLSADGVVVPFRSIDLSAEVDGRIVEKSENARPGRTVRAGELLLRIDPATYRLQVARLERERDQAQASLAELKVQIQNVEASVELAKEDVALHRADLRRIEDLERRGAGTQQARDNARRAELASRTTLVNLENEKRLLEAQQVRLEQAVALVEAQLEQAKLDLTRTEVRAPVDGVIASMTIEQEGYLRKGDPIATIEDTSAIEVRTNLEMRTIAWLRAHLPSESEAALGPYDVPPVPVTVAYDVLGNTYSWRGVLSRLDGVGVDERTRTVPCRVLVREPQAVSLKAGSPDVPFSGPPALMRGMYVKILLHTQPVEPLLSVPEMAVRPGNAVWVVRDGKLAYISLPAARVTRGAVLVSPQVTDLKAGDQVVISPLPAAVDGMAVRVHEEQSSDRLAEEARWASQSSRIVEGG